MGVVDVSPVTAMQLLLLCHCIMVLCIKVKWERQLSTMIVLRAVSVLLLFLLGPVRPGAPFPDACLGFVCLYSTT